MRFASNPLKPLLNFLIFLITCYQYLKVFKAIISATKIFILNRDIFILTLRGFKLFFSCKFGSDCCSLSFTCIFIIARLYFNSYFSPQTQAHKYQSSNCVSTFPSCFKDTPNLGFMCFMVIL